jgi:hypothetical protein
MEGRTTLELFEQVRTSLIASWRSHLLSTDVDLHELLDKALSKDPYELAGMYRVSGGDVMLLPILQEENKDALVALAGKHGDRLDQLFEALPEGLSHAYFQHVRFLISCLEQL